jgi:hypothetical protein
VQLPDTTVAAGGFLDLFGRPARESPCECERSSTVSLGQTLNLVNGETINGSISDPNGRLAQLMKTNPTDRKLLEEVFLSTLCRFPTEKEVAKALPVLKVTPAAVQDVIAAAGKEKVPTEEEARSRLRLQAAQDIMWALINSPAFLFNR